MARSREVIENFAPHFMTKGSRHLIVVGHGAAGLAAALSAAESAAAIEEAIHITLIDKAPENAAGGNTRWSPSYTRMAAPDRVEPNFIEDMLAATQCKGDRRYFTRLAQEAPATIKWVTAHNIEFTRPTYYLAKGPPRIQPQGAGASESSVISVSHARPFTPNAALDSFASAPSNSPKPPRQYGQARHEGGEADGELEERRNRVMLHQMLSSKRNRSAAFLLLLLAADRPPVRCWAFYACALGVTGRRLVAGGG
jgi:hypothetical protein